jgi:hypothetical protein
MAIASRRFLEYPFHSRLSRLTCLAVGVALLWFGSGQLTVAGLLVMFSGLVIAVAAVQPPQPFLPSPHRAVYLNDHRAPEGFRLPVAAEHR